MITLLARLLKTLNSDDSPAQIALAVVLAAFSGLTPLWSPHNLLIIVLVLTIRINLSMFFLSLGAFTLIAYLIDPVSHWLGLAILQADALMMVWNELYNNGFWRFMAYNNSLVIGSVSVCAVLSLPLFWGSRWVVIHYREHIFQWVNKMRLATWLKGSRLYTAYNSIKD